MTPSSVSLEGCRTRAEAHARLSAWHERMAAHELRTLESSLLAANDDDMDAVDRVMDEARQSWVDARAWMLRKVDDILDQLKADNGGSEERLFSQKQGVKDRTA